MCPDVASPQGDIGSLCPREPRNAEALGAFIGVRIPIHVRRVFSSPNHSRLLSQGVRRCRMPGSPPAVTVRSLLWCSRCEPPYGAGPPILHCHPPHQPWHCAPFGSINTAFAGTVLVVLPYPAPTQSLSWLVRGHDDCAGAGLPHVPGATKEPRMRVSPPLLQ